MTDSTDPTPTAARSDRSRRDETSSEGDPTARRSARGDARVGSWIEVAVGAGAALTLMSPAWLARFEPLGVALWAIVVAILLLPLAWTPRGVARAAYVAAGVVLALAVTVAGGWLAGVVIAAVASSLLGGASILVALRARADAAIGLTIVGALIALTWPIWAADLLTRVRTEPWLQWAIDVSPAFALNATIAPDDPLTHRPLAYKLMNLGQDVSYAMPTGVWWCVVLHGAIGSLGASVVPNRRTQRAPCHPERR